MDPKKGFAQKSTQKGLEKNCRISIALFHFSKQFLPLSIVGLTCCQFFVVYATVKRFVRWNRFSWGMREKLTVTVAAECEGLSNPQRDQWMSHSPPNSFIFVKIEVSKHVRSSLWLQLYTGAQKLVAVHSWLYPTKVISNSNSK